MSALRFKAVCLIAACLSFSAFAKPSWAAASLDIVCQMTPCRPAGKVNVQVGAQEASEVDIKQTPYFYNDTASVVAGETIFLEATLNGADLKKLEYVKENKHPERTIVLTLAILNKDPQKIGTLLTVQNPLGRALVYKALFHAANTNVLKETSVCPVMAGLSAYEQWPFPMYQMALYNFQLVSDTEAQTLTCN